MQLCPVAVKVGLTGHYMEFATFRSGLFGFIVEVFEAFGGSYLCGEVLPGFLSLLQVGAS